MSAWRRRWAGSDEEGGFALIFVMLVTTLVMMGTATMPDRHRGQHRTRQAESGRARRAGGRPVRRAGLRCQLNTRCASYSIQACGWLTPSPTVTGSIGGESWTVTPQNAASYL